MASIFVLVFGLLIGSFLTVCIYRLPSGIDLELPEEDEPGDFPDLDFATPPPPGLTINNPPRSFCPKCRSQLRWYHNIPFFSWVALRGRCAFCKAPIPARYPLVELITGTCALLSYLGWGLSPTAAVIFLYCCALIVISVIDYDFYIIPDSISLPGTAIGVGLGLVNQFFEVFSAPVSRGLLSSCLGILFGAGFLYVVAKVYHSVRKVEGLGFGDVKLLAMVGAAFGPHCAIYTIFLGSLAGSIIGALLILLNGRRMSQALPFGPYLALGTMLYLFGSPLFDSLGLDPFYGMRMLTERDR